MNALFDTIRSDWNYQLLAELAGQFRVKVYLVGGGLRDVVMGREIRDYDFALDGSAEALPAEFAARIGGHFFWLDRERLQSRVVAGRGKGALTFDFSPVRGRDIAEDLARRDFTINALALPVAKAPGILLDPLDGLADIAAKRIRACGAASFDDDPLRLLRALRFAATLGFTVEADTWQAMLKRPQLLAGVAGERIRDEFVLVLDAEGVESSMNMLAESGLLPMIIPGFGREGAADLDLDGHIGRAVAVERIVENPSRYFPSEGPQLAEYLRRRVEGEIPLASLVKLASLLAGEDCRSSIESCSDRICLGTKARRELAALCACAMTFPALPAGAGAMRARFRFYRDREPAGPELVFQPLAAGLITRETAACLVSYYFHDYRPQDPDLLLSGGEVMELLGVPPGQELGRVMELLRAAERIGQVSSPEDAREFLLKTVDNSESIG